jgi:hypothetical protein
MACVCNLGAIEKECGRNAPGLKTILYLACVDDIATIGAATAHEVSTITPVASQGFFPVNIIRQNNDMNSEPSEDGGYTTTVTGFISKQAAAKANVLTQLATDENYIAIPTDQNGLKHIVGALDHPVKVRAKPVTTPRNGYELTVTWEGHADIPYIFTGSVPMHP